MTEQAGTSPWLAEGRHSAGKSASTPVWVMMKECWLDHSSAPAIRSENTMLLLQ